MQPGTDWDTYRCTLRPTYRSKAEKTSPPVLRKGLLAREEHLSQKPPDSLPAQSRLDTHRSTPDPCRMARRHQVLDGRGEAETDRLPGLRDQYPAVPFATWIYIQLRTEYHWLVGRHPYVSGEGRMERSKRRSR